MGQHITAQALREQLMAPQAIERVHGLRALELELAECPTAALARELEAFTARGIPYYAPQDPGYQAWVAKAVSYCERLNDKTAPAANAARHSRRAARHAA